MIPFSPLAGVYAAALTPIHDDLTLDHEGLLFLLDYLAQNGAHGALLLGTTGEGPSFSTQERANIFRHASKIRETHPDFRLLAGTTVPSHDETAKLNRIAFDLGYDAVLMLPPYYFRGATDAGLFDWFSTVIRTSVPADGAVFGYHIPKVSGVALSFDLLTQLRDAFPAQFIGIKDSTGSREFAQDVGARFGKDLLIMNGTDRLLTDALGLGAGGCITALANLISPDLREIFDAHQRGETAPDAQARANASRAVMERFMPAAPLLKFFGHRFFGFPQWTVKPPLRNISPERAEPAAHAWETRFE